MADLKISALTASTTPLAGTEVLPIVQSSTTKQVSVANLTAGRAVSMQSITANNTGLGTPVANFESGDQSASRVAIINTGVGGQTYHLVTGNPGVSNSGFALFDSTNSATRFYVGSSTGDFTLNTGNLVIGTAAKGVNFTANTPQAGMTSQLLNWYEEGTFTPTLSGATTTTYTTQTGRYTRVGRLVTFQCELEINSLGNGSTTTFVLGTLPNAGHFSTISVGFFSSVATAVSSLTGYINNGANSVVMQSVTVAATSSASNAIFGNSARIIVSGQYSV